MEVFSNIIPQNYKMKSHSSIIDDEIIECCDNFEEFWKNECVEISSEWKFILQHLIDTLLKFSNTDLKIIIPSIYQVLSIIVKASDCLECQQRLNSLVMKSGKFI